MPKVDDADTILKHSFDFFRGRQTSVSDVFCVQPGAPSSLVFARAPSDPAVGWHFGVQVVRHTGDLLNSNRNASIIVNEV